MHSRYTGNPWKGQRRRLDRPPPRSTAGRLSALGCSPPGRRLLATVSRWHQPASADEEVDVLLHAELQDDHELAGVVEVPLEKRVDASLVRLVGDLLQAGQDRGALDRCQVGAVVVGMIEEWRHDGG